MRERGNRETKEKERGGKGGGRKKGRNESWPITHVVLKVGIATGQQELAAALVVSILAGEVERRESSEIPRVQGCTLGPQSLGQGCHGSAVTSPRCLVQS